MNKPQPKITNNGTWSDGQDIEICPIAENSSVVIFWDCVNLIGCNG